MKKVWAEAKVEVLDVTMTASGGTDYTKPDGSYISAQEVDGCDIPGHEEGPHLCINGYVTGSGSVDTEGMS